MLKKYLFVAFIGLPTLLQADEYAPVDWIQVTEKGIIKMKLGFSVNARCIAINANFNGVWYSTVSSKWQRRGEDSEWINVPGTERSGEVCGWIPDMPGEYRLVADIEIDGALKKYASGNTLIIASDPETEDESASISVVEVISWGMVKAKKVRQ